MPALISLISADARTITRVTEILTARGHEVLRAGVGPEPWPPGRRPDLVIIDTELGDVDAPTILTHDMKTPVVNLQGLVGLLEQDHAPSLPPQAVEYLTRLRRNADRLEELLRDLLEYPRRLSLLGPRETVPSAPIVSAAMDGLQ